ncbi:tetratricopeptide repeat protein [Kitasatospora sp. NPDC057965]|uniref:tetratricopeptide repeat protein n=1 Tax=Kitasatospora sp. NPDC057965 TaxID=3346291 RepID=UPI0036DC06A7
MLDHLITHDDTLRMVPTDRDELTAAVDRLHDELRALPQGADPARTRLLTRWIGIGQMSLGHHDEAREFLRQSLDLAASTGNTRAVVATSLNLGDAHRYAGDVQAADALYRSALTTARSRHPELLDYALQHTGKHLMERGELTDAQALLQEALRLRIAKGDTGLIESTQAALDRVALLTGQADGPAAGGTVPPGWSGRWTAWLQSRTTARTPGRWAEDFPTLRNAVAGLTAHQCVHPRHLRHLRDQSFPAELIAAMAGEAEKAVATDGYVHNGKWNAAVGDIANSFAGHVDLAAVVSRSTGLDVEQPHTAVYIEYREEGQFLDFHLDETGFGDANLILCLKHERPADSSTASSTVFINADGYLACDLPVGDCVVFDGVFTPHGRTPLSAGENVTLISFGFRARDQASRTVKPLPSVPR